MHISFIGCPCSGKTTTAAMAFASLKELGISCEFTPEQARWYIAQKRVIDRLKPEDPCKLDDHDQLSIMLGQLIHDNTIRTAVGPDIITVSDSSPLNSLLYMNEEKRPEGASLITTLGNQTDLVFYAKPVTRDGGLDPNRIHSESESLKIDELIPVVINQYFPEVWKKVIVLDGTPKNRLGKVTEAILSNRF